MSTIELVTRPENADPAVWAHPEEWEPGIPIYDVDQCDGWQTMLWMVEDAGPGYDEDHPDGWDPTCDTCTGWDGDGWRWGPFKQAVHSDGTGEVASFTPFYGAAPRLPGKP